MRVTSNRKSDKELAFLQDLFIAPDWGERFAELIDEHVSFPKKAKRFTSPPEPAACNGAARARRRQTRVALRRRKSGVHGAGASKSNRNQRTNRLSVLHQLDKLDLNDNSFDLVIGNASLVSRQTSAQVFSELVRVAAPGATIALHCRPHRASASSFRSTGKHCTISDCSITNQTSSS